MSLNSASQLGQTIAALMNKKDEIKRTMRPDDPYGQLELNSTASVILQGTVQFYRLQYGESSFIIDHPVYGYINSPTLRIDGGYEILLQVSFPLSFPIIWTSSNGSVLIFQEVL